MHQGTYARRTSRRQAWGSHGVHHLSGVQAQMAHNTRREAAASANMAHHITRRSPACVLISAKTPRRKTRGSLIMSHLAAIPFFRLGGLQYANWSWNSFANTLTIAVSAGVQWINKNLARPRIFSRTNTRPLANASATACVSFH